MGIEYNKRHETNIEINKKIGSLTKSVLSLKENVFFFMVQGQIALKKESDGNDNKLIGISNKCNTQTV